MTKLSNGKQRLVLVQTNNRYGDNVYLPYSVGLLWAYAQTVPGVAESWELDTFIYVKEPIERALDRIALANSRTGRGETSEAPQLIAISCYIWNWRWSLAFAEAAKHRWPSCEVLVGGVQIPDASPKTLEDHPFIDYAIFGEGEGPFAELLLALTQSRRTDSRADSLVKVGNLVWRKYTTDIVVNKHRTFADPDKLRSPYLDGVFDGILDDGPKWQALQETNRGCPYACTFCAWGAAALSRVRQLDMDRILGEIDWFADRGCTYVENCDANFGILPRDTEIIDKLVKTKLERGAPTRFRAAWAKNSNEKVFDMARRLHKADMLKAVTLSVQSMDDKVLGIIKRKNIKYDNLSRLIGQYEAEGIPTYTELIIGLPGESLEMFISGIDRLLEAGQHDGLFVYPCMLLPNTEMYEPGHVVEHGIRSVSMQAMLLHGTPEPDAVQEMQEIIVETKAMPHADWIYAYMYSWAIQCFHVCGLTQYIAVRSRSDLGIAYHGFYEKMISWMQGEASAASVEYKIVRNTLERALVGGSWNLMDPRFGPVSWPPEEFSYLRLLCEADRFYDGLRDSFVDSICTTAAAAEKMREFIEDQRQIIQRPPPGQEFEWARENVWYGRKGSGAKKRMRKETAA